MRSQLQHWYCVGVSAPKHYRQLWVKDLPKVPTWQLEWNSNLQLSCKSPNLPCFNLTQVVRDYHSRKELIAALEREVGTLRKQLEDHKKEVEKVKQRWIVPLQALIDRINVKFSEFFRLMKCAGEVNLKIPDNPVWTRGLPMYQQGVYIGQYMAYRRSRYIDGLICFDIFSCRYFYKSYKWMN